MQKLFSKLEIEELEKRYKVNLINSLSGYKSANLIGTINSKGTTNLCIVSSVVHLGSEPALLGFIMRPTTAPRHTYNNLLYNQSFTINQVSKYIVGKAHYTSVRFEEEESEFEQLQLEEEYLEDFPAPFVKESQIKTGLVYKEEHLLSNGCRLIVGQIKHLCVAKTAINKDGSLNLESIDSVAVSGLSKYHTGKFLKEFPYAKKEDIKSQLSIKQKERPDNVVFNDETKKYDAALKKYSTNVGAPAIQFPDLNNWKRIGSSKVNHHLKTKYDKLKKQYEDTMELYEWNQLVYTSKFNFEPITGEIYHLYEDKKQALFLSHISPEEWDKKHIGSFQLDVDRIFIKV